VWSNLKKFQKSSYNSSVHKSGAMEQENTFWRVTRNEENTRKTAENIRELLKILVFILIEFCEDFTSSKQPMNMKKISWIF
jgi:hypothetical protein